MDLKTVQGLRPFQKFCMSIGELPSSYKNSLSYLDLLMWFCDYLENKVIPTINNNAEAVTEIQTLFTELKNFIDNYFENLDVQNEINNKLDSLTADGTLYNIMYPYFSLFLSDLTEKYDVLKSRMNEFTALPDGSTTGDAELIDIRVGYDGLTYPNAGDSVRSQLNYLNNSINNLKDFINVNINFTKTNKYYDKYMQAYEFNNYYQAFIDVIPGQKFLLTSQSNYNACRYIVVDSENNPLSYSTNTDNQLYTDTEIVIPPKGKTLILQSQANYLSISALKSYKIKDFLTISNALPIINQSLEQSYSLINPLYGKTAIFCR